MTGGPHGGWASGSAWAAMDFVPHDEQLGCYPSDAWVRAMAPGVVTRSSFGAVVVDSDGDGYAGTGWAITYQHVETRDRVAVGTRVETGDPCIPPARAASPTARTSTFREPTTAAGSPQMATCPSS